MKIIRLKHSLLFLRINPDNDTVKCFFLFFISWNCFVGETITHSLNTLSLSQVKDFYKTLANDYNRKYRI